jgi:phage recombination protein Bet
MTKTTSTSLAITPEIAAAWSPAQIDLIRDMSAKNCTDDEFKVLLYVAHKYNLDPLTKQIYAQKYATWGDQPDRPAAIIITYAGMLEIANRMNMLDGLSSEIVYDAKGNIQGARSCLWKKGCTHPFQTEVDLEEYIQYGKNKRGESYTMGLWGTKPKTMIRKVANAQNIRQAFSLGQMYIEEEMPTPQEEPKPEPIEAKVIQETIHTPAPTKVSDLDLGIQARLRTAMAIDLEYGVKTTDMFGNWLNDLGTGHVYKVSIALIKAHTFGQIAAALGIKNFDSFIRDKYPDANTQAQKFAATIHYIYEWAAQVNRHLDERAEVKEAMRESKPEPATAR